MKAKDLYKRLDIDFDIENHVPLDMNGEYSTSVNLAQSINIKQTSEICEYFGVHVGIIGKTIHNNIDELYNNVKKVCLFIND